MVCNYRDNFNTSSWVCLSVPERGWGMPRPWFLYLQQFNRDWPLLSYFEAVVIFAICVASYLTNFIAVVKFHRLKIRPQLFCLLTALSVCNCAFTSVGTLLATTRFIDDWPFGQVGCTGFFAGSLVASTCSMWILAIISAERCANLNAINARHPRAYNFSMARVGTLLGVLVISNLGLWSYVYLWLQLALTKTVVLSDTIIITVCTIFTYRVPQGGNIHAAFVFSAIFVIPLTIIAVNYTRILIASQRIKGRLDALHNKKKPPRDGARIDMDVTLVAMRHVSTPRYQCWREVFMAKLIACSFALFVVTHAPFFSFIFFVTGDAAENVVDSSIFTLCMTLLYANAAVNPLLLTIEPVWSQRKAVTALIATWNRPLLKHDEHYEQQRDVLNIKQLEVSNSPVLTAKNPGSTELEPTENIAVLRPSSILLD